MDGKKAALLIAGAGALYYLATQTGGPTYYNMDGQPITDALCGSSATFNVPGYTRIWLSLLKDKTLNFDGPYDLPMPAYIFSCSTDVGVYDVAVYEIDANDQKGKLIGQTTFTVHARA